MEIEQILRKELLDFTFMDFIGLSAACGLSIHNADGSIRHDFEVIEDELVDFFFSLPKTKRNKLLRRIRQVAKYNRVHKV